MLTNIFKGLVFFIFFIEIFIGFTLRELERGIQGEITKTEIGWNLVSGYILRIYMAYIMLRGLFA